MQDHVETTLESENVKRRSGLMRSLLYLGSALAVIVGTPGIAAAQEEEDIVVTGQRRAQLLEEVPASVVAISPQLLEDAGVATMQDIGQITPGVQVNFAGAYTQPAIRGVSTITNGNGVENNVALYVDGFYEPSNILINQDLANLQSIEILKGPQGTLYGRNATGGAILINTLRPSNELTGLIEGTVASFDDHRLRGYISGPLSDRVRFGVGAYWRDMEGYLDLNTPPAPLIAPAESLSMEQRSLRAKLEIDLTENLLATFAYNYTYNDDPRGIIFTPYEHLSAANLALAPGMRATRRDQVSYNSPTALETTLHQGTATFDWDIDIGRFVSRTSWATNKNYNAFDSDGTYANTSNSIIQFREDTFQQGFDLEIDVWDNFNLLLGALYYKNDLGTDPDGGHIRNFAGGALFTSQRVGFVTEAVALYADGTINLTPRLEVTLGGRVSSEEKDIYNQLFNSVGTQTVNQSRNADWTDFTPRAAIRYELGERTSIYANYARGFRSGTFQVSIPSNPALWRAVEPEIVDGYEVGFKTAQPDYRFEIAAFYYDYSDMHSSSTQPNPLTGSFDTVFANVDSAESYGVDGLLEWAATDNLDFRLGFAWLNAEFVRYPNAVGTALNVTTDRNVSGVIQNWSGHQLPRSPEFSGSFGVVYNIDLAGGDLQLAANAAYTDSYVINNPSLFGGTPTSGPALPANPRANEQRYRQDAYTLVNASATWTSPDQSYWISVFGNNLTDEEYLVINTGGAGGDRGNFAPPANYGVRLGYEF